MLTLQYDGYELPNYFLLSAKQRSFVIDMAGRHSSMAWVLLLLVGISRSFAAAQGILSLVSSLPDCAVGNLLLQKTNAHLLRRIVPPKRSPQQRAPYQILHVFVRTHTSG